MKNMSGLDGLFLHLETPATPMHVAALYVLEPPAARCAGLCRRDRATAAAAAGAGAFLSRPAGADAAAVCQPGVD
jgi:hypothetical protein